MWKVLHQKETAWESIRTKLPKVHWARLIWFKEATPSHAFIFWLALRNAINTGDHLARHGVLHLDHCVLCQDAQVETIHHLFVDCEYSQRIWVHILGKNRLKFPRVLNWGQAKHWFCAHFRGNDLVGRIRAELKIPAVTYHKWEPPPLGTVAVNCDGSLRNRLGVSGYVLRKNFWNVLQEKSN